MLGDYEVACGRRFVAGGIMYNMGHLGCLGFGSMGILVLVCGDC